MKFKLPLTIGLLIAAIALALVIMSRHSDDAALRDDADGTDWAAPGATYGEQHFSSLVQIDASNVAQLGLQWWNDLPPGNTVTQPLAIDGIVYFVTGNAIVRAVDGQSGRLLWEYDSETYKFAGRKLRPAWGPRGIAWWNGKIFLGAQDGRLIALDARNGKPVWVARTLPATDMSYITGAPRAFDGKIIIGFGGADVGPVRGYVSTYDAETGKLLWRWHTVPGNPANGFENDAMKMAAKTWAGEWWKLGGGGTVWNAISYDPDTSTIFIGVGNGSPQNHKARSAGKGDNLFLCSIVALDARSGKYKWHYQVNPGETWDYTATNDMQFADLEIDGKMRKVLMTAPKNGFFYVVDRISGQLISAEPIAKVTWAERIDLKTGRPIETPGARYPNGTTAVIWPSGFGAHNWYSMAFSPRTKLAYVPVVERGQSWTDWELKNNRWRELSPISTLQAAAARRFTGENNPLYGTSRLEAWNPITQKRAWVRDTPGIQGGGVMATAGNLVFQGQLDGRFNAYAADSGKLLWSFQTSAPILAPPIAYSVDGQQYVTVLTGVSGAVALLGKEMSAFPVDYRGQARRIVTFSLSGKMKLPPPNPVETAPIPDPGYKPIQAQADRGARTFGLRCTPCHGVVAIAGGAAPDLRTSAIIQSPEAFASVVKQGALLPNGMPRFDDVSVSDLADIREYVRSQAYLWRRQAPNQANPKSK